MKRVPIITVAIMAAIMIGSTNLLSARNTESPLMTFYRDFEESFVQADIDEAHASLTAFRKKYVFEVAEYREDPMYDWIDYVTTMRYFSVFQERRNFQKATEILEVVRDLFPEFNGIEESGDPYYDSLSLVLGEWAKQRTKLKLRNGEQDLTEYLRFLNRPQKETSNK